MHSAAGIVVLHRRPGIPIGLESGPGQLLKAIEHIADLLRCGFVLRRPGNDAGRMPVLERQRVGDLPDQLRITAQHRDVRALPALVILLSLQVGRRRAARRPDFLEFNHHRAGSATGS